MFACLLTLKLFPCAAVYAQPLFTDLSDSYARTEIEALAQAEVLAGYPNGTFAPAKSINRAEFAKLMVMALGLKENPAFAAKFADIDPKAWYAGYVGAVVEAGIAEGTAASAFSPNAEVSREELVVFFTRAFGLEGMARKLPIDTPFTDMGKMSDWSKPYVNLAYKIGFVQGFENKDGTLSFRPKETTDRQDAARLTYEFIVNIAKYMEKSQRINQTRSRQSEKIDRSHTGNEPLELLSPAVLLMHAVTVTKTICIKKQKKGYPKSRFCLQKRRSV